MFLKTKMSLESFILLMVVITMALVTGALLYFVEKPNPEYTAKRNVEHQISQETNQAESFLKMAVYLKDNRTDICFIWHQGGNAESVATVPCEKIPPKMLRLIF